MRKVMRILVVALAIGLPLAETNDARAAEVDVYTAPLGGGQFAYRWQINYADGVGFPGDPRPIAGFSVVNANTGFGVTTLSALAAPAGWLYFPPDPTPDPNNPGQPLVDALDYFASGPAFHQPVGDPLLGGFSFRSNRPPPTPFAACPADYVLELIDDQGRPFTPRCFVIPEPSCIVALAGAVLCLSRRRRVITANG